MGGQWQGNMNCQPNYCGGGGSTFVLIVVLFILLIIVGSTFI